MAILTRPGATIEASTPPIDTGLTGTLGVRVMDGQGTTTTARTTAGIVETPADSGIYVATLTAPDTAGDYLLVWDTGDDPPEYFTEDLRVLAVTEFPEAFDGATFATLDELALRLPGTAVTGVDLTAKQQAQGAMLLGLATSKIAAAVGKDQDWVESLATVHPVLRGVCLEMVARTMTNPSGARSESETLGQYSHATSFTDAAHSLDLTDREVMLCRRAIIGRLSGSSRPGSIVDRLRYATGAEPAMGGLVVDPTLDDEDESEG